MPLFNFESPSPHTQSEDISEAKLQQKQAKIAERRVGQFLAMMLEDLRFKLRSRRERQIIREEERRLRLQNKWARIVWRQSFWK